MNKMLELLEEFILKAIIITEEILRIDLSENVDIDGFTEKRDRIFLIIDQISRDINWKEIDNDKKNELNKRIEYIKKLDEKLLTNLHAYQSKLKQEIEQTVRQKDNIKGYNLSVVK